MKPRPWYSELHCYKWLLKWFSFSFTPPPPRVPPPLPTTPHFPFTSCFHWEFNLLPLSVFYGLITLTTPVGSSRSLTFLTRWAFVQSHYTVWFMASLQEKHSGASFLPSSFIWFWKLARSISIEILQSELWKSLPVKLTVYFVSSTAFLCMQSVI